MTLAANERGMRSMIVPSSMRTLTYGDCPRETPLRLRFEREAYTIGKRLAPS